MSEEFKPESSPETIDVKLSKGQIGYVDRYGISHTFDTPDQLSEFREEENDRDNK